MSGAADAPRTPTTPTNATMSDMDIFAAMGIAGFGKAVQKKTLDPARFDKNRREEVRHPRY